MVGPADVILHGCHHYRTPWEILWTRDTGTGSLSGFFAGDVDGAITGAGLAYAMTSDVGGVDISVSGAAAFRLDDIVVRESPVVGPNIPPPP